MANDTSLESSYALLLESVKKKTILQKTDFFLKIQSSSLRLTNVQKLIEYTFFEKPLTMPFQIR